MSKVLDLGRSVYDLAAEYPELVDIMESLGFTEITKKPMLNSVGRMMTIPKGAKMKNIPMAEIIAELMKNGFELAGEMPVGSITISEEKEIVKTKEEINRTEQLKAYLKRLGTGEDLESVRADFVKNFSEVEASEIMSAEQELLSEGTPLEEVQKLCDVHSALFHGATQEEQIANAEKAVEESVQSDRTGKKAKAAALVAITGHPLQTFTAENMALTKLLEAVKLEISSGNRIDSLVEEIRNISIHYAKKGDLLYPHLKVCYDISGPSNVMWTVDDEIRDELAALSKDPKHNEEWLERVQNVLQRADEMIYKEANILFPICAVNFTEDEWVQIYQDAKDYAECFGVNGKEWDKAEAKLSEINETKTSYQAADEIVMPGGHLTLEQLTAMLNTIPIEITFVDGDNINRYFNEGPKVFKRPGMAIDREVFTCHPPKIEAMVRMILEDFRNNRRDSVPVWMDKGGKTFLVTYMAVRDQNKKYLGTVEVVQDMEFAKKHFNESKGVD